ncbi:MAG: hypothetical protein GX491_21245 [Chloroflexi bacterium]|nr:hypothetical protein [Chloroflexota bacterium]
MHWLAVLIILVNLALSGSSLSVSQETVEIEDLGVSYAFGETISFRAQVRPAAKVREVQVFITPEGQSTVWKTMDLQGDGAASVDIDVQQLAVLPFSSIEYRYEVVLEEDQILSSETFHFTYEDDRFNWQKASNDRFEVYWYGESSTLGQEILNISQLGLQQATNLLDASIEFPLRIYAYTSSEDLQTALKMKDRPWIAGHASPQHDMILISVPAGPEQKLELERQIPHEMMHLLQYQLVGERVQQQPVWLMEGMASLAELYPNPEYQRVLESIQDTQELLSIGSLCAAFPREAAGAFRAYAESESFTRFIYEKYGKSGLRALIERYDDGLGCEEGVSAALGVSLAQLEYRWRQEALGINASGLALSNLTPYLLVGLVVLIPAALALIPYHSKRATTEKRS